MPMPWTVWCVRLGFLLPFLSFFAPSMGFLAQQWISFGAVAFSLALLGVVLRPLFWSRAHSLWLGVTGLLSMVLVIRGAFLGNVLFTFFGAADAPWQSVFGFLLSMAWLFMVQQAHAAGHVDTRTVRVTFSVAAAALLLSLFLSATFPTLFTDSTFGHPLNFFLGLAVLYAASPYWMSPQAYWLWLLIAPFLWIFGDVTVSLLFSVLSGVHLLAWKKKRHVVWWIFGVTSTLIAVIFASPFAMSVAWPRYATLARPSWSALVDVFPLFTLGDWFFGTGVQSFANVFFRGMPASVASSPYWSLSFVSGPSTLSTLFVQWGGVGLFSVLVLLAGAFWSFRSISRWLVVLAFVLMLWWPLSHPFLLFLAFALLILSDSPQQGRRSSHVFSSGFTIVLSVTGIIFAFLGILSRYWVETSRLVVTSDPERSLRALDRALVIHGYDGTLSLEMAQRLLHVVRIVSQDEQVDTEQVSALAEASVIYAVRATTLAPRSPLLWIGRSAHYLQLARAADGAEQFAVRSAEEATALAPRHPAAWNALGRARSAEYIQLISEKQDATVSLAGARNAYERALALRPSYVVARLGLSSVALAEGDGAAAVRILEEGLALVPRDVSLMTQLGVLYLQQGKLDQASVVLNDVLTLSPTAANARWYLSYVLEAQSQSAEALEQVEILQERFPENATIQQRAATLSKPIAAPEPSTPGLQPAPLVDEPVAN